MAEISSVSWFSLIEREADPARVSMGSTVPPSAQAVTLVEDSLGAKVTAAKATSDWWQVTSRVGL